MSRLSARRRRRALPHPSPLMATPRRDRRGSALILVLVAMVVLLVLSSGAMMGSMQELRISRTLAMQQRAQAAAEFGMTNELANWPATRSSMANGAIDSSVVVIQTGDTARVRVQRLNAKTYNVVSIGRAAIGSGLLEAQRQTSMLVRVSGGGRLRPLGLLTMNDDVQIQGSALVDGRNTAPPGWTDCATFPTGDTTAIAYDPSTVPQVQKANQTVGALRSNPLAADPNTYNDIGGETWAALAARAGIKVSGNLNPAPVGSATSCTMSSSNWGEPYRGNGSVAGCQNYFPLIYSAGDLDLQGNGRGQGILIVDGRLRIRGNFEFYGLILVGQRFEMEGSSQVYGAVMVNAPTNEDSKIIGNATMRFSHCALGKAAAALGGGTVTRTKTRSWAQVY
ncbi:MAG: hypothetical protein K2R93_01310 [Gemmatimonadaceae bacterium]|nr:hypothetical protein [Gemmatimonadaceae bacterium]